MSARCDSEIVICGKCLSTVCFCTCVFVLCMLSDYYVESIGISSFWIIFLISGVIGSIISLILLALMLCYICNLCISPVGILQSICDMITCFQRIKTKLLIFFILFTCVILIPWIIFIILYTILGAELAVMIAGIIAAFMLIMLLLCLMLPKCKKSICEKKKKKQKPKLNDLEENNKINKDNPGKK